MRPQIKKYLNVFQYLQDIYSHRKNIDSTFSYDAWAQELKASDKSYVRMMVLGKRPINTKMAYVFSENLKLVDSELEYFLVLVEYTQSKTRTQKDLLGKKLISLLKSELDQLEIQSHYEFLSNPVLPRLQVLLGFHDIDQSLQNLSWLLNISEEETEKALLKLVELELVEKNQTGYKPLKKSFKVGDSFGDLGLKAFYHQNLSAAQAAIDLPSEERRFKSLFLPLNKDEFSIFLGNLQNFVSEQLQKFNPDEYSDRRLYQVHFNIIPVSSKRDSQDLIN